MQPTFTTTFCSVFSAQVFVSSVQRHALSVGQLVTVNGKEATIYSFRPELPPYHSTDGSGAWSFKARFK